ncbi:MAG: hypothetical protein GC179_23835 [Anaerolineaceae bacterium]|nr:hypothetical protein [Anaerolineaceae bacterium]
MNTEVASITKETHKRIQRGQGLAEYSLIIALVGLVCVLALSLLGKGTKSAIYKVTCAVGSTDPQCACINEKLTVTSTYPNGCSGNTLIVTVKSSCSVSAITVNGSSGVTPLSVSWSNAPVCTGGASTFNVQTYQSSPYNTSNSYNVSRP